MADDDGGVAVDPGSPPPAAGTGSTAGPSGAPSPAPASSPAGELGPVDWSSYIPPEYAKEKLWEPLKGKDLGTVLKGYAEGQKARGGSISLPGKDATPEQLAAWHTDLQGKLAAAGLIEAPPEKPEDYQIERPPIVAEMGWSDEREAGFRKTAHALGLTQEQVQALVNWQAEDLTHMVRLGEATIQASTHALQQEWGGNFDARLGRGEQFLNQYFDADTRAAMKKSGINNHVGFIKGIVRAGSRMAEHGDLPGQVEGQRTPAEIDTEIAALREKAKTTPREADRLVIMDQIHALHQEKLGDKNEVKFVLGGR